MAYLRNGTCTYLDAWLDESSDCVEYGKSGPMGRAFNFHGCVNSLNI